MNRLDRIIRMLGLLFGMALFLPTAAGAEAPKTNLRIGISPFEPFVILDEGAPRGVSIDGWKVLNTYLHVDYEFVICKGVADKLEKLAADEIDIAIGGITISEDRETRFDFSHPIFNSGLDIMITARGEPRLRHLVTSLFSGQKRLFLAGLVVLMIIAGHLIWMVERSRPESSTHFDRRYFPGVLEGIYWALITASTVGYGDKVPKGWPGRIVTGVIILTCLPLFGYFIAQLSSDITMYRLRSDISSLKDLSHKRVAVVTGTTSETEMATTNARLVAFERAREAYDALLQGRVNAVVYDAPQLRYFAANAGRGVVEVIGKPFAPQDYGIALAPGSPLRESLNRAILTIKESGELQSIHERWFSPGKDTPGRGD
ncbi:MAG: transporter substrate-binding domain-containing protein [Desulfobacterales bacterium]|nr:transporter substrate-binding domain-containing protein [Desulfobacterales bacterium]MDJ0991506.1 transporter substrate-binding domain-containing protein [Desulfobacterales bacterium]